MKQHLLSGRSQDYRRSVLLHVATHILHWPSRYKRQNTVDMSPQTRDNLLGKGGGALQPGRAAKRLKPTGHSQSSVILLLQTSWLTVTTLVVNNFKPYKQTKRQHTQYFWQLKKKPTMSVELESKSTNYVAAFLWKSIIIHKIRYQVFETKYHDDQWKQPEATTRTTPTA